MTTEVPICKILVFDSGAGGLTVAREILAKITGCELVYLSDNLYFPYGTMPDEPLIARVLQVLSEAIADLAPDIVVVACNTASTLALEKLRNHHPKTEFVGVVPAIKPAVAHSSSKVIGLLATPATVNRQYTEKLIEDFAQGATVVKYGSSDLVQLAESWLNGYSIEYDVLEHEINQLLRLPAANNMDTVVLACTHFPLFRPLLDKIEAFKSIVWIDSGSAIANRVSFLIARKQLKLAEKTSIRYLFTNNDTKPRLLPVFNNYLHLNKPSEL